MKEKYFQCYYIDKEKNSCEENSSYFFMNTTEHTKEIYFAAICKKHQKYVGIGYNEAFNETAIRISKEKFIKYIVII